MGQKNGKALEVTPESTNNVPFLPKEIQMYQKHYAVLKLNVEENGKILYTYFFSHYPEVMSKFTFASQNSTNINELDTTLKDARLLFHIRRVFAVFGEIIESLTNGSQYAKAMKHVEKVGMTHQRFMLKKEDFQKFKEALIHMIKNRLKSQCDDTAKFTWSRLVDQIIQHMLIGIEQQRLKDETKLKELELDDLNADYAKIDLRGSRYSVIQGAL